MASHEEIRHVFKNTTVALIIALTLAAANAAPPTDADCTSDVPFADTDNCTCYYQCFDVGSSWMLVHLDCPSGGIWDDVNKACVAGVCEEPTTTVAPTTTDPTTPDDLDSTSSTDLVSSTASGSSSPSATSDASTPAVSSSSPEASSIPSTTASQSEEPTTMIVSTTAGPPTFVCTSTGFFAHPTDPTKYYQCVLIGAQFYYYIYTCPPSSCFQQSAGVCVVGACESSNTTAAPPATTAVTSPPVDIICDSQGQYPFPGSCTKYYNCILLDDGFVYYVFECPPGSYFNAATSLCTTGQCPSTPVTTAATTTTPTTTTAVAPTTTTTAAPDHPCPTEGYFVDPADCQSYYRCIIINGQMYRYMFRCPAGSYWNSNLQGCIVGTCPTTTTGMTTPSQTSTTTVTTPSPPQPFSCSQVGVFPDSSNCSIYHRCLNINGQLYLYNYACPPTTRFDSSTQLCVVGSC